LNLTLSFYDLYRTNVVVTQLIDDGIDDNAPVTDSVVDGEQRSRGIDLDYSWVITDSFQILGGASLMNATVTEAGVDLDRVGRPTGRTAREMFALAAKYAFKDGGLKGLSFTGGVKYRGKAYADSAGGQADFNGDGVNSVGENDNRRNVYVPGVTTVDMGVSYKFRPTGSRFTHTFRVNANNLLDRKYIGVDGRAADLRVISAAYGVKF
jgi:outer membrane receptor protein involved in Fe transport